jgi:hypothetical protein
MRGTAVPTPHHKKHGRMEGYGSVNEEVIGGSDEDATADHLLNFRLFVQRVPNDEILVVFGVVSGGGGRFVMVKSANQ